MNLHQWFQRLSSLESPRHNGTESDTPQIELGVDNSRYEPGDATTASERGAPKPVDEDAQGPMASPDTLLLSIARDAMACQFEVLLNQYQYPKGIETASHALEVVAQLEAIFSVYKPRSEFSTLNRFGFERAVPLSFDSMTLLELAIDIHRLTGGAFDVTAGSLSEVWGFSRRAGAIPTKDELAAALSCVGSKHLVLDHATRTARLAARGAQVNPGGIGKGYALDRVVGRMFSAGIRDFMVHGGLSSVVARGNRQHSSTGGGWLVALKHPWRWEETLGTIRLRDQALGTSGSGKQFFHFGGKRYSHIIDPRTGWPAQGMMSVTVICPSGAVADALATALFVLGPQLASDFCARHGYLGAILIFQDESGRTILETHNLPPETWTPA